MEFIDWKDIKGHEGYMVSNTGLIKSKDRVVIDKNGNKRKLKGKNLKSLIGYGGYEVIQIRVKGVKSCMYVHRVVAEHFCDGFDKDYVVNHIDENKMNNNSYNLEFVTLSENYNHSRKGRGFLKRKFTKEQITNIREMHKKGMSLNKISISLNENSGTISNIINKKTYKNI